MAKKQPAANAPRHPHIVLRRVKHGAEGEDPVIHAAGDVLHLAPEEAAPLVAIGAVKPAPAPAAPGAPAAPDATPKKPD